MKYVVLGFALIHLAVIIRGVIRQRTIAKEERTNRMSSLRKEVITYRGKRFATYLSAAMALVLLTFRATYYVLSAIYVSTLVFYLFSLVLILLAVEESYYFLRYIKHPSNLRQRSSKIPRIISWGYLMYLLIHLTMTW